MTKCFRLLAFTPVSDHNEMKDKSNLADLVSITKISISTPTIQRVLTISADR